MNTYFHNLASTLLLFVLFVGTASADITDLVNSTPTATTSAASAPEAAKSTTPVVDTSKLLHCAKNYGRVILEDKSSQMMSHYLTRVKLPSTILAPTFRHAAKQAGCFTLVEPGTPGVKLKLKLEMSPPELGNNYQAGRSIGTSVAAAHVPLVGGFLASFARQQEAKKIYELHFSTAMVTLTIVDMESGEEVVSVLGQANSDDASLGAALIATDTPDILSGDIGKNISTQVIATEFADGLNKLVPAMDKLNAVPAPVASSAK